MTADETRRVEAQVSKELLKRTDALAAALDTDRTEILTTALRKHLREVTRDDELVQKIAGAYYDDEITFEQLQGLVGHGEAANFRVLKRQLSEEYTEELAEL